MEKRKILKQLWAIALCDVGKVYRVQEGGIELLPMDSWDKKTRLAVASVEKGTGGLKVKFYDKLKALELLGKALGLFDGGGLPDRQSEDLLQSLLEQTRKEEKLGILGETTAGNDLVEPGEYPGL